MHKTSPTRHPSANHNLKQANLYRKIQSSTANMSTAVGDDISTKGKSAPTRLELSRLPAEAIIVIFSILPNFTDAYNLATASKRFRAIFAESSISILKSIAVSRSSSSTVVVLEHHSFIRCRPSILGPKTPWLAAKPINCLTVDYL